jgi:hypothetical protein
MLLVRVHRTCIVLDVIDCSAAIGPYLLFCYTNFPEFLPNLNTKKITYCNANVCFSELLKVSEFRKDAKKLQKH